MTPTEELIAWAKGFVLRHSSFFIGYAAAKSPDGQYYDYVHENCGEIYFTSMVNQVETYVNMTDEAATKIMSYLRKHHLMR